MADIRIEGNQDGNFNNGRIAGNADNLKAVNSAVPLIKNKKGRPALNLRATLFCMAPTGFEPVT